MATFTIYFTDNRAPITEIWSRAHLVSVLSAMDPAVQFVPGDIYRLPSITSKPAQKCAALNISRIISDKNKAIFLNASHYGGDAAEQKAAPVPAETP